MNLNALHRRLLQDVLEIGNAFPFVITGGYAVQAHGLVDRWSRDIDVATNSPVPGDYALGGLPVEMVAAALLMTAACAWGLARRLAEYR